MPSIEIVCIDQKSPVRFGELPFVVRSERVLRSHRYPSHFQKGFDKLEGCIYHFGGQYLRNRRGGIFQAYDLLSLGCRGQHQSRYLEFKRSVIPLLRRILKKLLEKSPQSRIVFTSDYQFSPNKPKRVNGVLLSEFWKLHQDKQLRFNTWYEIVPSTNRLTSGSTRPE